eukprot:TRINITY_DN31822_c0_g1_i1.p1 TRINITY_DN31822_c0_g1~~TRINITY_DN31822_c0_g1_i1.p1  ORF type:complete len:724 (+),score=156.32 TRINITY_DN31822_c0_g1_i1:89-2260(+)
MQRQVSGGSTTPRDITLKFSPDAKAEPKRRPKRRIPSKLKNLPVAEQMTALHPRLGLAEDSQLEYLATCFPAGGKKALQAMANLMQGGVVDCIVWDRDPGRPPSICAASGKSGDHVDLVDPVPMPPTAGCTLFDTESCLALVIDQLEASVRAVTQAALASDASLVDLAADAPLQVCVLVQRVRFTKAWTKAKRDGRGSKGCLADLAATRQDLLCRLKEDEVKEATTIEVLLALLHEQSSLMAEFQKLEKDKMADAAEQQAALIESYPQFTYHQDTGTVRMALAGNELEIGTQYCAGEMMITTEFTRLLRSAYINTMLQPDEEKRVLVLCGPPGSGKERLIRDVGRLCGTLPTAVRAFDTTPEDEAWWERRIRAAVDSSGGHMAPFIVSQADRMSAAAVSKILVAGLKHQAALCFTVVPGSRADALKSGVLSKATFVTMPPPDMKVIAEGLCLSKGVKSKSLPGQIADLLSCLEKECSQQPHYDFGTRTLSQLAGQIGHEVLSAGTFADEMQITASVIRRCILPKLLPADILILQALLTKHFNFDLHLPSPSEDAATRLGRVVTYIRDITRLEPDCMVLPMSSGDQDKFLIEFCKGLNADGATSLQIEKSLCDLSVEELLGTMPKKGEPVKDGLLVKTLRDAMDMPNDDEHKVWVIIKTGDISMDKWECLFELLNDSGCLNLPTGEQLRLSEWLRYMFILPNAGKTDRSVFARSAVIWASSEEA